MNKRKADRTEQSVQDSPSLCIKMSQSLQPNPYSYIIVMFPISAITCLFDYFRVA